MAEFNFVSRSHDDTIRFGCLLGRALQAGSVVGLTGDLGAGKTCFVKGVAYGINNIHEDEVTSPTFTIMQEYEGLIPLYHFDAYRLAGTDDLEDIGFFEYINAAGACIIEWADRILEALPAEALLITIEIVNQTERRFCCKSTGARHASMLETFCKGIGQKS